MRPLSSVKYFTCWEVRRSWTIEIAIGTLDRWDSFLYNVHKDIAKELQLLKLLIVKDCSRLSEKEHDMLDTLLAKMATILVFFRLRVN